ncbi:DUF1566 domain-containing protein [Alkalimonas sp. NCh-2]|uniref:Lcl C-terminal domain-containing protein n=1 Tax=Alkalimonas sp. NCh-2 TaxID=3144846 RepID=UPI0031F654FD
MEQFEKNEDGTVTDTKNGLIWSKTLAEDVDLSDAEKAVAELGDGWRLPTIDELQLIVDRSTHSPAANEEIFPDTKSDWYWSSTPCAWNTAARWVVDFYDGHVGDGLRGYYACVRAVRASQ